MIVLRVVLVEPREAGNVGAVARSMKNFGFADLVIVGEHPQLQPVAEWWASGAGDVVASARKVSTLQSALAGSHLTIATTSSRGRNAEPDLDPPAVATLAERLAPGEILSLVFGREDRGLTRSELDLCHRTAIIPTSPSLPTMNLAQSVAIFCYELSREDRRAPAAGKVETLPAGRADPAETHPRAAAELIERLHERAQALLVEAGFLHSNNPDRIYSDLRAIAGRADLDQREVEILLGMIRQLEWAIRH